MVCAENWDTVLAGGWRWRANFIDDPEANRATVEALREEYGEGRVFVTVGFDHEAMRPFVSATDGLGVYVRDADDLLAELQEDLLNWDNGHSMERNTGTPEIL